MARPRPVMSMMKIVVVIRFGFHQKAPLGFTERWNFQNTKNVLLYYFTIEMSKPSRTSLEI
jgi:hypothetical protein